VGDGDYDILFSPPRTTYILHSWLVPCSDGGGYILHHLLYYLLVPIPVCLHVLERLFSPWDLSLSASV